LDSWKLCQVLGQRQRLLYRHLKNKRKQKPWVFTPLWVYLYLR
jgi:hypothetical protein